MVGPISLLRGDRTFMDGVFQGGGINGIWCQEDEEQLLQLISWLVSRC